MTTCRTCKSDRLYLFLPLGDHPLANGFLREEQLSESEALFPLDVHVCLDCGLSLPLGSSSATMNIRSVSGS